MPFHCPVTDSFQDLNLLHTNQKKHSDENTEWWTHLFIAFSLLHVLYITINFCSSSWIIKKELQAFDSFQVLNMQLKTLSITGKLGKNTASDPIIIASSMSNAWPSIVPHLKKFWTVHYYPFEGNYLKVSDWARSKEGST